MARKTSEEVLGVPGDEGAGQRAFGERAAAQVRGDAGNLLDAEVKKAMNAIMAATAIA